MDLSCSLPSYLYSGSLARLEVPYHKAHAREQKVELFWIVQSPGDVLSVRSWLSALLAALVTV